VNHDDAQELLAAYALDAVGAEEAEALLAHIEDCPRCRQELAGYLMVTSALSASAGVAPPELWDKIASHLEELPQPLHVLPRAQPATYRWATWGLRAVAVAAAAAIALLSWDVSHLDGRVGRLQTAVSRAGVAQAADAAALNPHFRKLELRSASGVLTAEVEVAPGGQAYLVSSTLPALSAGRTYQLWGLARSRPVSLGLLGPLPAPSAFRLDDQVKALMITAEPAGGVVAPTTPVLVQAAV